MKYTCPLSINTIDHHVVRLASFFNLLLIIMTSFHILGTYSPLLMLFLFLDMLARKYQDKWSLLKYISVNILHGLIKLKPKEIGSAPKKFAAGIGASFALLIFISSFFLSIPFVHTLFYILNALFAIAVSLEAFFGFCIGCLLYSLFQSLKKKNHK